MSILLVDDSKFQLEALKATLREQGYSNIFTATSASQALQILNDNRDMDLVLMDLEMPDLNGIDTCKLIKTHQQLQEVPVIIVTVRADPDTLASAFQAGAMDFVTKPPQPVELAARVGSAIRLRQETRRRKQREKDLLDLNRKLSEANRMLRKLSAIDSLTGIANRGYFDKMLYQEWNQARREGGTLGLIMADIDNFKAYNDNYGHQGGDQCLRQVCKAMHSALHRPSDLLARYGGEEFAALLPDTDPEGAVQVAERMRARVEEEAMAHLHSNAAPVVTISLGVSCLQPSSVNRPEELVSRADKNLYRAKEQGRNRVAS